MTSFLNAYPQVLLCTVMNTITCLRTGMKNQDYNYLNKKLRNVGWSFFICCQPKDVLIYIYFERFRGTLVSWNFIFKIHAFILFMAPVTAANFLMLISLYGIMVISWFYSGSQKNQSDQFSMIYWEVEVARGRLYCS